MSPFDIVRVENKTDDSVTYGVVQDILHITDGTGHLSNYVSSDFGNVDTIPMTRRLSLSYAKVSVIHNTKENFMPVFEGALSIPLITMISKLLSAWITLMRELQFLLD